MVLYKIDTQAKKYPATKLKSCHYKIEISEIKEFEEQKVTETCIHKFFSDSHFVRP